MLENVLAIMQNTPIGATFIIAIVISIIISLNCPKKFATTDALLPNFASITPTNSAKTIIGSISPSDKDVKIFFGIMFSSVSAKFTFSVCSVAAADETVIFMTIPGFSSDAIPSATQIANAVVNK